MIKYLLDILRSWEIDVKQIAAKLLIGVVVFLIFYILAKSSRHLAYKVNAKIFSKHPDFQKILSAVYYYLFLLVGAYLFLEILGLEQYLFKILAGAGIIGIIAGFALKDIASNAFSGLLLNLEKPYKKGDWVQVDGHYGQINEVGILTTALINRTGQQVYVSNQLIYSGVFINYSAHQKRGVCIHADIIQYFDLETLQSLLQEQIQKLPTVIPNQDFKILVSAITKDGNYSIEIFFWVLFDNEKNYLTTINDTFVIIKEISIKNTIDIRNTVWMSSEENTTGAGDYGVGG